MRKVGLTKRDVERFYFKAIRCRWWSVFLLAKNRSVCACTHWKLLTIGPYASKDKLVIIYLGNIRHKLGKCNSIKYEKMYWERHLKRIANQINKGRNSMKFHIFILMYFA